MNNGQQNQAISDDQELASVLKGMRKPGHSMATSDPASHSQEGPGLNFEEAPAPANLPPAPAEIPAPSGELPSLPPLPGDVTPAEPAVAEPTSPAVAAPAATPQRGSSALDAIKKEALEELRPLVDKLSLPPKEKFDTMLLIIRSTDDNSLLEPAHLAAKAIPDEAERAQALLDVIKEIDYFSSQNAA